MQVLRTYATLQWNVFSSASGWLAQTDQHAQLSEAPGGDNPTTFDFQART